MSSAPPAKPATMVGVVGVRNRRTGRSTSYDALLATLAGEFGLTFPAGTRSSEST